MKEELQSATQIQQLNALNRHDEALKSLSQDSDGQTYQVGVMATDSSIGPPPPQIHFLSFEDS